MMSSTRKLSERQTRMLQFIADFLMEHPYPPSVREIQMGCNISSTSVVDYNLHILRREGYIKRSPDISRGIELLGRTGEGGRPGMQAVMSVPIYGAIAAGEPLLAYPDSAEPTETLDLPASLLPATGNVYALRVKGQSMVEDLIDDGDVVLLQRRETARPGEMVAAWLKDPGEATLKRYFPEGRQVRLQPANSAMDPIIVSADNLEVQGVVVGVIRMYR